MSEEKRSNLRGLNLLDNIDHRALIEFVCMCSRFEFALKQVSDYRGGNENYIKVRWDLFSKKYDEEIHADTTLTEAISTLEKNTIQKQIIDSSNELDWVDDNNTEIINKVYRIRNNLFHGGKENNRNTSRNVELLIAGSLILDVAWTLDADVKTAYIRV